MAGVSSPSTDELLTHLERLSSHQVSSKSHEIEPLLEKLKILSRSPNSATDLSTSRALSVLGQFAFSTPTSSVSTSASKTALATLANVCLHIPAARAALGSDVDGSVDKCLARLEDDDVELSFLSARLLFFMSTSTPSLFTTPNARTAIQKALQRFIDVYDTPAWTNFHNLALTDLLKLLFSICQSQSPPTDTDLDLGPTIASVVSLITKLNASDPPSFTKYAFNALMTVLDLTSPSESTSKLLFPQSSPTTLTKHMIAILTRLLTNKTTTPSDLETSTIALFSALRVFYARGPHSIRTLMKSSLLPSDSERNVPLGRSKSLSSSLLNLTVTPSSLRDVVSELLFELSDRDASTFIHNVGYGFAAGYLINHGIGVPVPNNATIAGTEVNPITGQRVDMQETSDPFAGMSDEEKEREAERLFVLFQRLEATGMVDVENPVARALREGRLE